MEHRADLIGATFRIDSGEEGGSVVRCMLPRSAARDA
jgi:signal transduction histidine kinase